MAKQIRKWNPGDAANIFIRVILSDAGALLGGLSEDEWDRTLAYFDGRCAYTGAELIDGQVDRDHAIPMNQMHCGLHLFGNVLPTTRAVNRKKGSKHYREFVTDGAMLERIEAFVVESGYTGRVAQLGDLQRYCQAQYKAIDSLCRVNRGYLRSLLAVEEPARSVATRRPTPPRRRLDRDGVLPIHLDPESEADFKSALLREKRAYMTIHYSDGSSEVKTWNAARFTETSHVKGNLRSRPQFRSGTWQKLGITKVEVSIRRPRGER